MDLHRRVAVAAAGAALLAAPSAVAADPSGEDACHEVLVAITKTCTDIKTAQGDKLAELQASPFAKLCGAGALDGGCNQLATLLELNINGLADSAPPPPTPANPDPAVERVAQPDRQTATNKSGTAAQTEPVESVQPINLAGGAISLAGTRSGTQVVGTVTINPLALGRSSSPVPGRIFDISITAPFNLNGAAGDNVRFFGGRLRVNATAPWSSANLRTALDTYYKAAGVFADTLEALLRAAPDVKRCTESVARYRRVIAEDCGGTVEQARMEMLRGKSYDALARAQREADRYYLGLDLRVDVGDPTGDTILGDDGTRIQGGLAGGFRVPTGANWDVEFRGHIGGDYFRPEQVAGMGIDAVYSVDFGGAILLSGHASAETDKQRLAFGAGVVGRRARDNMAAALVPTNFVDLRLMAVVPATSGGDLGLAFTIPLDDSAVPRGTIVSLSTDLGLLDGTTRPSTSGKR